MKWFDWLVGAIFAVGIAAAFWFNEAIITKFFVPPIAAAFGIGFGIIGAVLFVFFRKKKLRYRKYNGVSKKCVQPEYFFGGEYAPLPRPESGSPNLIFDFKRELENCFAEK